MVKPLIVVRCDWTLKKQANPWSNHVKEKLLSLADGIQIIRDIIGNPQVGFIRCGYLTKRAANGPTPYNRNIQRAEWE